MSMITYNPRQHEPASIQPLMREMNERALIVYHVKRWDRIQEANELSMTFEQMVSLVAQELGCDPDIHDNLIEDVFTHGDSKWKDILMTATIREGLNNYVAGRLQDGVEQGLFFQNEATNQDIQDQVTMVLEALVDPTVDYKALNADLTPAELEYLDGLELDYEPYAKAIDEMIRFWIRHNPSARPSPERMAELEADNEVVSV